VVTIFILIYQNWTSIFINLRIINDGSFFTRGNMYASLWKGIKANYLIMPHGFYAANNYIRMVTSLKHPHNDILGYLYDLGIVFIGIILFMINNLRRFINANILFLLLYVIACALQNMMFSFYIWIPMFLILLIYRKEKIIL
jgi:hypothetical protein